MEKYVDCHNCKEQYDCERTYLGGCTDGKEWEEKPLLSKSDKEFYFTLMTNCKKVIEKCPNIEERRLACEYCRFEQVRKKAVEEYERKLAEHEEFVKCANEEVESLKYKSSYKNSWKNKFFKAQEEVERLNQCYDMLNYESARKEEYIETLKKQVDELNAKNKHLDSENTRLVCEMDKLLDDGWDIMDEEADGWYKKGSKDTAKEILTELLHTSFEKTVTVSNYKKSKEDIEIVAKVILTSINEKIKEIAKRKGVEVE